ncbi:AAA family ATPase [Caldibacillus thermoamylovorans]|uniref:AAA family ATPase n=1 Tax=Caldibacillus thermoamylovorans TaxID=35841 RepID=UPI001D081B2B|nr:AAA family ATPase [Caldibacillus thermoamylovorans]MCB5934467.1 AAA family ATPase [Bacillus sp. DFI.2.34]MCB7076442.1 AAA family ATPase [Caldibacillus thermoamylovorans]
MIKINKLEIENVKRVKAVKIEPTPNGLTIVGGKNNQGKTSVLDAIAWALGGNKYRPSQANREGSVVPPYLHIVLSNGLVVERKGKNSDLKVIDPNGQKAGQQLLDSFVEELAINLPKFMHSTSKEKANILLQIIGVGDKLAELERKEMELYNNRHAIGQIADQKAKFAKEQPYYPDAPKELISASTLIQQQQEILAQNGENQKKRNRLAQIQQEYTLQGQEVERLTRLLAEAQKKYNMLAQDLEIAQKDALDLIDESTEELEQNIQQIDEINRKVRANLDKEKAEEEANEYRNQYDNLTNQIEKIRKQKTDLLTNADLPLEGLSVEDGELVYKGQKWDNMSGSDQLKVSTAIVRKLKPDCGFILLDKLEQMDLDTLKEFGQWLEQEGLQAIATRVSTGDECSIIIEDGYAVGQKSVVDQPVVPTAPTTWKAGEF